jgi:hypothetical protein
MQRSLIALPLAVALLALTAVPAGSATRVLFPGNCHTPSYKPTRIVVTCGDANNVLARIKWESYGTDVASGSATALVNTCDPNCAQGKFHRYPAVVDLKSPKDCGRYTQFTKLVETFTHRKPKGSKSKLTEKSPCANRR